jgi:hypothetical protein
LHAKNFRSVNQRERRALATRQNLKNLHKFNVLGLILSSSSRIPVGAGQEHPAA